MHGNSEVMMKVATTFPIAVDATVISPVTQPVPDAAPRIVPRVRGKVAALCVIYRYRTPGTGLTSHVTHKRLHVTSSIAMVVMNDTVVTGAVLPTGPLSPANGSGAFYVDNAVAVGPGGP